MKDILDYLYSINYTLVLSAFFREPEFEFCDPLEEEDSEDLKLLTLLLVDFPSFSTLFCISLPLLFDFSSDSSLPCISLVLSDLIVMIKRRDRGLFG